MKIVAQEAALVCLYLYLSLYLCTCISDEEKLGGRMRREMMIAAQEAAKGRLPSQKERREKKRKKKEEKKRKKKEHGKKEDKEICKREASKSASPSPFSASILLQTKRGKGKG